MEKLSTEILLVIFPLLENPGPFSQTAKHYRDFSAAPYVRARYFIERYGRTQALFRAVGVPGVLTPEVIDALIAAGAVYSRYLAQSILQTFTRGALHFLKNSSRWGKPKHLSFRSFSHLMKVASDLYGDELDPTRNEDDGMRFGRWLTEAQRAGGPLPGGVTANSVKWEEVEEIFTKYNFMPFSDKDPLLAEFPRALSIEPRILPLARANGFVLDSNYRDYIFEKAFEKKELRNAGGGGGAGNNADSEEELEPAERDKRVKRIVEKVKEYQRLDSTLFLSRTVASEVCIDSTKNPIAYEALKQLDLEGELHFELADLVRDLLKLFKTSRSVLSESTLLTRLWSDFPCPDDRSVLEVVLLVIFTSKDVKTLQQSRDKMVEMSVRIGPGGFDRDAVVHLLANPFIGEKEDDAQLVLDFACTYLDLGEDDVEVVVRDVVVKCLERPSKGNLLAILLEKYPQMKKTIRRAIKTYAIDIDALSEDPPKFKTKINYDYESSRNDVYGLFKDDERALEDEDEEDDAENTQPQPAEAGPSTATNGTLNGTGNAPGSLLNPVEDSGALPAPPTASELGHVSQSGLASRLAEEGSSSFYYGRRRRSYWHNSFGGRSEDKSLRLAYPESSLPVAIAILEAFGPKHRVTAEFFTHAIVNGNTHVVAFYCDESVPITLRHFQMLAKLGRRPLEPQWDVIETAPFYEDDNAYLGPDSDSEAESDAAAPSSAPAAPVSKYKGKGKARADQPPPPAPEDTKPASEMDEDEEASDRPRKRRQPRRSTVAVRYKEDDDEFDQLPAPDDDEEDVKPVRRAGRRGRSSAIPPNHDLGKWIWHLTKMSKEEDTKWKYRKAKLKAKVEEEEKAEALAAAAAKETGSAPPKNGAASAKKKMKPVNKTEFHRSLASHIGGLKELEKERAKRLADEAAAAAAMGFVSSDDEEESEEEEEEEEEESEEEEKEEEEPPRKRAIRATAAASASTSKAKGKGKAKALTVTAKGKRKAAAKPKPTPKAKAKAQTKPTSRRRSTRTSAVPAAASASTAKGKGKKRARSASPSEEEEEGDGAVPGPSTSTSTAPASKRSKMKPAASDGGGGVGTSSPSREDLSKSIFGGGSGGESELSEEEGPRAGEAMEE